MINLGFGIENWRNFRTPLRTDRIDVKIEYAPSSVLRSKSFELSTNNDGLLVYKQLDGWIVIDERYKANLPIGMSFDYRHVKVYAPNREALRFNVSLGLLRIPLECLFIHHATLSLHASCVELGGEAVCFTADSGVGKSTRARAWVDGLGAEFISGDRPAIRLEEGGNLACGVPWDGKEQIFRNVERPLKAILEVRRAPFTRLRRLSPEQAFGVLIRQSFIPMWDTDTAALAMANVRRLSRTTPVYRLFCGPEVDDARAVHRILFEHPEEIEEELPEMKVREGFVLRTVVDEHMVMPTGANIGKFGGAVVLNDVSAFIWKQLEKPISREDLLAQILGEFDVDEATASRDLDALLDQLREMELLEE